MPIQSRCRRSAERVSEHADPCTIDAPFKRITALASCCEQLIDEERYISRLRNQVPNRLTIPSRCLVIRQREPDCCHDPTLRCELSCENLEPIRIPSESVRKHHQATA